MSLLELEDVTVRYGGLVALSEARLQVERGTLVGLIGPNGAGKTTLIDCLAGFTPATSGRMIFDGHDVTSMSAHRRTRLGMIRTFQSLELFDDLSVRDNCRVAASTRRTHFTIFQIYRVVALGAAQEPAEPLDRSSHTRGARRRRVGGMAARVS